MYRRLQRLRKENGFTCSDMATLLGLKTKAGYSKKERGRTKFSLDDAKKISRFFGEPIDAIFFEK